MNVYGMINGKMIENPTDKQLEDPALMLYRSDGTPLYRAWHRRSEEPRGKCEHKVIIENETTGDPLRPLLVCIKCGEKQRNDLTNI